MHLEDVNIFLLRYITEKSKVKLNVALCLTNYHTMYM
jgi:hypothetical protein